MKFFNTMARGTETFVPLEPGRVGIYVCGPTVQSEPHVGHGRSAVAFDVLARYLAWSGFDVTFVRNVTDVDDKIINRAAETGATTHEVADAAFHAFSEAYRRLGNRPPDVEPKATEHIPDMIDLIERLIEADHAYSSDGDVYFSVRSFPGYGRLSRHDLDDLVAGERVEPSDRKRDPLDFALWKASKPGEPSWESPWGAGRPGWHIECSAMAARYLGDSFDIHAGGSDLIFPHHENEIAQSEAANGVELARFWMHNGMVNLSGEKMAKSTGHVVTLLEALDQWDPLAVRLFYLRTHYRKPLEFSREALDDAESSLGRLRSFRRRVPGPIEERPDASVLARFAASLEDDLDVAGGLAVLFETVRTANAALDAGDEVGSLVAAFDEMAAVLGLVDDDDEESVDVASVAGALGVEAASVDELVSLRDVARAEKDWARSDEIRDALSEVGIVIEDTADGTRWHRG